ncbi:hypothetical protein M3649_13130 [Ureibacillus chungkukjangi]|uniref:hypothetical protein n=1 Tax=Ureibacillus chungkukjangi TaxID=1202712 RepID=UPI0020418459|nr:hypothetical protein [Ureibacillus chungkukjangi]MCM3389080.1 hypothetical protein [Ureibacillus chungkukjangi]
MSKKYIVYGTGNFSEIVISKMNILNENIVFFVETKKTKEFYLGKEVISIDELENKLKLLNPKQRYVLLIANTFSNHLKGMLDLTKYEQDFNLELCFPFEWIEWIDNLNFFKYYHKMITYIDSIDIELAPLKNKKVFMNVV